MTKRSKRANGVNTDNSSSTRVMKTTQVMKKETIRRQKRKMIIQMKIDILGMNGLRIHGKNIILMMSSMDQRNMTDTKARMV